jgi:hypothetical protein
VSVSQLCAECPWHWSLRAGVNMLGHCDAYLHHSRVMIAAGQRCTCQGHCCCSCCCARARPGEMTALRPKYSSAECSRKTVVLTTWGASAEEMAALEGRDAPLLSITACRVTDFNGAPFPHSAPPASNQLQPADLPRCLRMVRTPATASGTPLCGLHAMLPLPHSLSRCHCLIWL